ncbi:MAG: aminoglycoside phosphotransferase family protein [Corynebacteriales bacterium]|nr:aminoglycoside phosphotransferase family protein [Mycobacteriales bacterium]
MLHISGELTRVLTLHGVEADALTPAGKWGVPRPVQRLISPYTPSVVVEIAQGSAGQLRIQREVHGRHWAATHDIDTAKLYAADPHGKWLVSEWLPSAKAPPISEYVSSALRSARQIADAPAPTGGPKAQQWRSPLPARLIRILRGLAQGPPMRLWWAARQAARELPRVPIAHGDFYHRNVLWRADTHRVCVIDWEYLGPAPRYADVMRMWTILPTRAARNHLIRELFATAPAAHQAEIALTGLWLTLRLIGENVKAPAAVRNAEDTAHARAMLMEASELAHAHGAWPL